MSTIVVSVFIGLYCAITKKVRWTTVLAFVIFVVFFSCMVSADKNSSKAVWGYLVLMGAGLGITLITLVTVAQLSTPPEQISLASGLLISIRSLGGTIGFAICMYPYPKTILTQELTMIDNAVFVAAMKNLGPNVGHATLEAGLPPTSIPEFVTNLLGQNTTALVAVPGVDPSIIGAGAGALLDAYSIAFRNVWVSAIGFIVLAAICKLSCPSLNFSRLILFAAAVFLSDPSEEFNNLIDAPVEKKEEMYSD
jgi:hypothetical protein